MGGFLRFKLHAIINKQQGELARVRLTPGNTDGCKPLLGMCEGLFGLRFADKSYVGQALAETLQGMGIRLVTTLKKNMTPVALTAFDKALLKRCSLVERVFDELKNLCQIKHTRHRRSTANCLVNLMAGIVAYCLSDNKPSLSLIHVNALTKA